jgi:hypothetical protein
MFGMRRFGIQLLSMTIGIALLFLAFNYIDPTTTALAGLTNQALFVLVGYAYLFPRSEIRLLFVSVRSTVILAVISAIVLILPLVSGQAFAAPLMMFSSGGYGLLIGVIYFHVRYQKYAVLLKPIRRVERFVGGERRTTPTRVAGTRGRVAVSSPARIRMPFQKTSVREMSDEERLNLILDRINEGSFHSLTDDEKRFLQEYSDRL